MVVEVEEVAAVRPADSMRIVSTALNYTRVVHVRPSRGTQPYVPGHRERRPDDRRPVRKAGVNGYVRLAPRVLDGVASAEALDDPLQEVSSMSCW